MTQRVNYGQQSPELVKHMMALSGALATSAIEAGIRHLVAIRCAQLNGCAFCLDMHSKEAKIHGERELRLYHLGVWWESPLFSAREKAALQWTEALTKLAPHGVSDEIYQSVRAELSEKELSDLSFVITTNNAWNRISIGFANMPGSADKMFGLDKAGLE